MNKALFLDRDGVINIDHGYVHTIEEFNFMPGIFELVRSANQREYKVVVVTNQSGIGRGYFSVLDFHRLSLWMIEEFSKDGCRIDLVMASGLNPEDENPSNFELMRRKPNPGLFLDAHEILDINFAESIMIGDKVTDLEPAVNLGMRSTYMVSDKKVNQSVGLCFETLDQIREELVWL